ncbi:MAG: hypothetical protein IPM37_08830 [Hahellaceae bacterium]|nr:hypothetical protein [Hahellaceae bacterium]
MTDRKARMTDEQRKRPRLLCNDKFRYLRLYSSEYNVVVEVTPVNYNCYGIAFFSSFPIEEGSALKFSLCYESDSMQVELDGLLGEVIYVTGSDIGFYAGVAFVSAQVEEPSALEALSLIESDLAHHQSDDDRYQQN